MSDSSSDVAGRSSFDSFLDPLRSKDYSSSPENNAWESFLVGKDGDNSSARETSVSYLDEFDTGSNDGDLLVGTR